MNSKLSVVLATYNEENNIKDCLECIKEIADEIIIVDGSSVDKTREIAKEFGARIIKTTNPPIFHINKQKSLVLAKYPWILQLDADERVSKELREEIKKIINMKDDEIEKYEEALPKRKLFLRHQKLLEERDGKIGSDSGEFAGFFVPRLNYFLGKFLKYGGVYPDGVIRLVKRNLAWFPVKSVHEQIVVEGRVGWLEHDLLHFDSPNFRRYLIRNSRYINLITNQMEEEKIEKNIIKFLDYFFLKPCMWFFMTQVRYKGILDGWQGIVFSFFSSLRFPRAYWRYLRK